MLKNEVYLAFHFRCILRFMRRIILSSLGLRKLYAGCNELLKRRTELARRAGNFML